MSDSSTNARTLAAYEQIAAEYADSTQGSPTGVAEAMLRSLVGALSGTGAVLELGSGPGWDADFLESLGVRVRRTDATSAFCDLQTSRGRHAERLDAITDRYTDSSWPAYDAVVALYVLQHLQRRDTATVVQKVSAALRPGGSFLVSVRTGTGDDWEGDLAGRRYHVTRWEDPAFEQLLRTAGLEPWSAAHTVDDEGPWLFVLARKG